MSDSEQQGSPADEGLGLVHALELDGRGGGRELGWKELSRGDRPRWIHLDRSHARANQWVANEAGVDPIVVEALLADETRPRATFLHGGLLVNLRGVNLNPGANPEDMISLRAWLEKDRLITVRLRPVMAVQGAYSSLLGGTGPARPAAILIAIVRGLVDRAGAIIEELDDLVGSAEDKLLGSAPAEMRMELSDVRRVAIMLRRYLAPQRDTLSRMPVEHAALFEQSEILMLRESSDGMLRLVEDLDAARDRAAVLHEELSARLAESMNRNMYLLSVVASIFMPLGLITGLFGINVAGMPWIENELGFIYISASLLLVGLIQYVVLKKLKVI